MRAAAGVTVALQLFIQMAAASAKLVCYFSNMSRYRPGEGKFLPENIDPLLCTHLVYSSAIINHENELRESERSEESLYRAFTQLKNRNSRLKIFLSVRGSSTGSQFSIMLSSSSQHHRFILSAVRLLRTRGFDGLHLDWENSGSEDGQRLSLLCKKLSQAFQSEGNGDTPLVLSAAVTAHTQLTGNELTDISKYMDFISVKTFDLCNDTNGVTAHHSPLFSANQDNIDYVINLLMQRGVPAGKLLIGFPTHARSFTLSSTAAGLGAPISGPASPGPFTQQSGVWSYYETCSFLRGTSSQWVEAQKVPFAVKGSQWVGFDNQRSYNAKVDYLRRRQLGGAAVWTLDMDDFSGQFCERGKYPLISHLNQKLTEGLTTAETPSSSPPSSPPSSSTETTQELLTSAADSSCLLNITVMFPVSSFCTHRADGLYATSQHPHTLYRCVQRKTYMTKCHSLGTQNSSMVTSAPSRAVVTVSLLFISVLHMLALWSVS